MSTSFVTLVTLKKNCEQKHCMSCSVEALRDMSKPFQYRLNHNPNCVILLNPIYPQNLFYFPLGNMVSSLHRNCLTLFRTFQVILEM